MSWTKNHVCRVAVGAGVFLLNTLVLLSLTGMIVSMFVAALPLLPHGH